MEAKESYVDLIFWLTVENSRTLQPSNLKYINISDYKIWIIDTRVGQCGYMFAATTRESWSMQWFDDELHRCAINGSTRWIRDLLSYPTYYYPKNGNWPRRIIKVDTCFSIFLTHCSTKKYYTLIKYSLENSNIGGNRLSFKKQVKRIFGQKVRETRLN